MLRAGSDINATNFKGNGPLHFAFGYGYDELREYLLSKGADASLINEAGHRARGQQDGPPAVQPVAFGDLLAGSGDLASVTTCRMVSTGRAARAHNF